MDPACSSARARFEQRHDVERELVGRYGRPRPGQPGQLQDVGDVGGRGREADDVAAAGVDAVARLGGGDPPERVEHLAQGHAGGQLRRARAGRPGSPRAPRRGPTACWRISSDARWNPNVPSCQRSSATSPQATRPRPSAASASWISTSSASRSAGPRVASGPRRRLAGQRRPRAPQPLGDEPEALPVRLVREASPELPVGLGQVLGVAGEARRERPRRRGRPASPRRSSASAAWPRPRSRAARGRPGCAGSSR